MSLLNKDYFIWLAFCSSFFSVEIPEPKQKVEMWRILYFFIYLNSFFGMFFKYRKY